MNNGGWHKNSFVPREIFFSLEISMAIYPVI